jgi:hypothetical protein
MKPIGVPRIALTWGLAFLAGVSAPVPAAADSSAGTIEGRIKSTATEANVTTTLPFSHT